MSSLELRKKNEEGEGEKGTGEGQKIKWLEKWGMDLGRVEEDSE